ncbi:phosphotransferase [Mesorhizobium muleiense]|uniref:Phosphotransferase enzyme family protein n=1 Tax=Mesorhizobium muleiense TaxID=1004279 RepID=A0A1G8HPH0_9HYPH|nr:phosphotransferase [Mesorhizobium muleiense]MCF6099442.1 aminoglycoside phosphotransferase family protein [Mesorhizobium muleiense]SDI08381.1 Phosphotransferase enzyme family protein [Mesorhizobium muleiense]
MALPEPEIVLGGGNVNVGVVRVGDTVRRAMSRSSPAIHRLLLHLESKAFNGSPRFLGIDGQQREILSYLHGEVGVHPRIWETDEALFSAAGLLRRYHDATKDFLILESDDWTFSYQDRRRHEVICHNDFAPYNFVFSARIPYAVIDFDLAGPGPRLRDVAYAAYWMTPLCFSAPEIKPYTEADVANSSRRLIRFCAHYGVPIDQALLDMVMEVLVDMGDEERVRAGLGAQAADRLRLGGHFEHWRREAEAFALNRGRIEGAIART